MCLSFSRAKRATPLIFVATAFLLLLWYAYHRGEPLEGVLSHIGRPSWYQGFRIHSYFPPLNESCPESDTRPQHACANFPTQRLNDVQIVFKTGIGERDRARVALETFASCIDNLLIVSDAPDHLAGHDVIDVLGELPPSYAADPDWSAYAAQREAFASGKTVSKSDGGWKLDRFKFLAMVDKAFEVNPHAKWYVFTETDIYMFWDTLFRMLDRLNPDKPHYLGSPSAGSFDRWFAYGGAGIVLSRGLVRKFLRDGKHRVSVKYEEMVRNDCCGDAVLAYAILEELPGVRMASLYPTFSGEVPQEVIVNKERWCQPLFSFHRVSAETMQKLWNWERCRPYTEAAITYSSFLDFGLAPLVQGAEIKDQWNNGADNKTGVETIPSASKCAEACASTADCLQFMYREGSCFLSDFVRVGNHAEDAAISGWKLPALEKLGFRHRDDLSTTCRSVHWLQPKIMAPERP